jgi:membrane protein
VVRGRRHRGDAHDDVAGPAAGSGAAHLTATEAAPDPGQRRPGLIDRVKAVLAWWQRTRPARANARFGARGGGVLTGGIAYAALFSVFAGLTIGYTVFIAVLGKNEQLRMSVTNAIAQSLPGVIKTSPHSKGLIDPASLHLNASLTVAGVVALVVLVLSAISATAALQTAVRAMFTGETSRPSENVVVGKLRQLAGFAGFAFAILFSAILTTATTSAAQWVLGALHMGGSTRLVLRLVGALVAFVIDAATFVLVVRLLAGQRPPWRDQLWGAVIAGVGIGIVRWLGTSVVAGSAQRNPALASIAVVLTLLVWVNLISRIVLLAAAWTANPPPQAAPPAPEATSPDAPQRGEARTALS